LAWNVWAEETGRFDDPRQNDELSSAIAGMARRIAVRDSAVPVREILPPIDRLLALSTPSSIAISHGPSGDFIVGSQAGSFLCSSSTSPAAGDLVFRAMSAVGIRDFGHAGIYIGSLVGSDAGSDAHQYVVEMQATLTGGLCQVVDLASFKGTASSAGYWGAYSVDLNAHQRSLVVAHALSYVGVAKYGFWNYKDPFSPKFRCDGLAEFVYELLGTHLPASIAYRGGLFEDDKWNTMSPASLRNCLFRKAP